MYTCKNGHEFSETESRGKIIRDGLPFLVCPFCGIEVPFDKLGHISITLKEHDKRLDDVAKKLEALMKKKS